MIMARMKEPAVFDRSVVTVASPGAGAAAVSAVSVNRRARRQAGFSLLELVIMMVIIAIVIGFAVIAINSLIPGIRANQATQQVVSTLREARMLAMSQNRVVRLQFTSNNRIETRAQVAGCTDLMDALCWEALTGITQTPSTTLEHGFQFFRRASLAVDTPDGLGPPIAHIVFGGTPVDPGAPRTFMFTADGFLAQVPNAEDPMNGTIFIGLPDSNDDNLTRAVTILGTTGRIRSWQWRGNGWVVTR